MVEPHSNTETQAEQTEPSTQPRPMQGILTIFGVDFSLCSIFTCTETQHSKGSPKA